MQAQECGRKSLLCLAVISLAAGLGTGLVAGSFRLALEYADVLRNEFLTWAQQNSVVGFILSVSGVAVATFIAAWILRRSGQPAVGSGIPHVEAVVSREMPPATFLLLPVKFVGGLLAIGSGHALGREGPSVQIGANIGWILGRGFQLSEQDRLAVIGGSAGAGLATAFNAPISGSIFVMEELVGRFEARLAITALGTSCAAIAAARVLIGSQPDFSVPHLPYAGAGSGPIFALLGIVAGFAGVIYNRTIVACNVWGQRWRAEWRALATGAVVGGLAWLAPSFVGGGDNLTQQILLGQAALTTLPLVFAIRFLLGPLSYSAGTPGGLFAPILVLGAQLGFAFGLLCQLLPGDIDVPPISFAIAGMAAFLAATVRAPVTGIALVIEMTAAFNQLLPMLWACFTAMIVPALLQNPPIYESLKKCTLNAVAKGHS